MFFHILKILIKLTYLIFTSLYPLLKPMKTNKFRRGIMNRRSVLKKNNNKNTILKILCIEAINIIGFSKFILHSHKQYADTSGDWRLILVDRNHYIPKDYQMNLTRLSNGKQVDSRIYPCRRCSTMPEQVVQPYLSGKDTEPFKTSSRL